MYRPIKEVDTSTPALRAVWWNPEKTTELPSPLMFHWKGLTAAALSALLMLGAGAAGLTISLPIIAGIVIFVVRKKRAIDKVKAANAVPVEATSLELIRAEISSAITKTEKQVGPDLGITSEEFNDAKAQNLLLVQSQGDGGTFNLAPGVYETIQTYVAIITPKGLGYLKGFYNTINATFSPDTRELILWKKVDRVVVSSNTLEIRVDDGPITVPLDSDSRVVSPGFGASITDLVNPFVREAQKRLEANA